MLRWIEAWLLGLPLGALVAAGAPAQLATGVRPVLAAVAGGGAVALAVELARRRATHDGDRDGHLLAAASTALAALPAALCVWIGLAPGALASLALVAVALGFALLRAARAQGPAPGPSRRALRAAAAVAAGTALFPLLGALLAGLRAGEASAIPRSRVDYVLDVDATVVTRPLPDCEARVATTRELARGAHPALDPDAETLWYDAPGPGGRRQIHRLDRATGDVVCVTCGQPGDNMHPRPHRGGAIFESDRDRGPSRPIDRDLYRTGDRSAGDARRLTRAPWPDRLGALDPGARVVVWSRGAGGAWSLVTAPIQRGHGSFRLGAPSLLEAGGRDFLALLAWSPDARTLVVRRGDARAPGPASGIDLATGRRVSLDAAGARVAAASFSADGGLLALATTVPGAARSRLAPALGFLAARVALLRGGGVAAGHRGTGVRIGPTGGDLEVVQLGDVAGWGEPTGIALEPDGRGFLLGQVRRSAAGDGERIVEARLACGD